MTSLDLITNWQRLAGPPRRVGLAVKISDHGNQTEAEGQCRECGSRERFRVTCCVYCDRDVCLSCLPAHEHNCGKSPNLEVEP